MDPIIGQPIGGKDPKKDFKITDEEVIEHWNDDIYDFNFRVEQHPNWELHYNLLTKFMDNTSSKTRTASLDKIRNMLKEPELPGSVEEGLS